jgi:hypothetical protein
MKVGMLLAVSVLVAANAFPDGVAAFESSILPPSSTSNGLRGLAPISPSLERPNDDGPGDAEDTRTVEDDGAHATRTTLNLKGEISVTSNPLPRTSDEKLVEFFQTAACRNLLVSGGGERPCSEVEMTPELLDDWRSRCVSLGARRPDERDSILAVVSRGIQFPGLHVRSVATVGVKYVDERDDRGRDGDVGRPGRSDRRTPRHEFVLLKNDSTASGLPPAVWIYNKLTGADKNRDNSSFKSLSTVTYEAKDDSVVFKTKAFLSIGLTFPKFLLRILPGDKSVIEEKAGKSVQNTLDKDVVQSMQAYEEAYLSTLKSPTL